MDPHGATEIQGQSAAIEKSLQTLIERNLEALLAVRFLASEYSTGKVHGGRIDTLGIDENRSPVIIEYKRSLNENVINQGLFYLDWLMDHKAEFLLLAQKHGLQGVDWTSPRLLCIASDFTKYDQYAVQQIDRSIELLRYRRYDNDLLLFELVNTSNAQGIWQSSITKPGTSSSAQQVSSGEDYLTRLDKAKEGLRDRFEALKAFLLALGDDVQMKPQKDYIAFKRIKNFACVEIQPQSDKLLVFVKIDPDSMTLEPEFTRDVRKVGHFGTGDLEIFVRSVDDLERAKPLIVKSYEAS